MALRSTPQTDIEAIDDDEYTGPLELTREQAIALFEKEVREKLGMSGEQFLRRLDAGEYDEIYDDSDHRDIGDLEMLSHVVR